MVLYIAHYIALFCILGYARAEFTNQQVIRASGLDANDYFGRSMSMSGDKMVVGAHLDDGATNGMAASGAVYMYTWNGTNWGDEQVIRASGLGTGDNFGFAVSMSGDKLVVGAYYEVGVGDEATNSGAVYTYTWNGTSWGNEKVLRAPVFSFANFGRSVSMSGDKMVVGAPSSLVAYTYTWDGTNWGDEQVIRASEWTLNDLFGYAVSMSGDKMVVGAHLDDGATNGMA